MEDSIDLSIIAERICKKNSLEMKVKVGEGGYKETFHVIEKGKDRALKVYKPGLGNERNHREIDAMCRCNHPNIAKLHTIGKHEINGQVYLFVLEEYLGGGTLYKRVKELGLLSRGDVINLGRQLISAVSHIQQLDLVHRDLKPENILFREEVNEAVITDFGIVRDLQKESLTQSWAVSGPGTYIYSAPEQLNNEKHLIDWRTDQFCLGVSLSLCTFGLHPYGDLDRVIERVALRANYSDQFIEMITRNQLLTLGKMVEPWSAKRYRTPGDLQKSWEEQGEKR